MTLSSLRMWHCYTLQAWTEQAQEGDSDVDAEPSDGGEWGDLSSSEVESSDEEEESSTTHQGGTSSAAPTSTVFSSCSSSDSDSSSSGSSESGSSDNESSSDSSSCGGSESGLFGDPSMSIPPNLPVPFRRKQPQRSAKVGWQPFTCTKTHLHVADVQVERQATTMLYIRACQSSHVQYAFGQYWLA